MTFTSEINDTIQDLGECLEAPRPNKAWCPRGTIIRICESLEGMDKRSTTIYDRGGNVKDSTISRVNNVK